MQKEQTFFTKNSAPVEFKRETLSELVHRHLLNESHTTSDDELRNVVLDIKLKEPFPDKIAKPA